jgi:3-oxoacyl-[acyl-carrier protein] reductase
MNMNRMQNKVAFVAGGGRGIGRATCFKLAEEGYRLAVAARTESELDEVVGTITTRGGNVDAYAFDIADDKAVNTAMNEVIRKHDRIDALVNSAGISYIGPVVMSKIDKCEEVLRVNLLGALIISKAALKPMIRQRSGRIVHIGSISGQIGAPYNAIYAASKAGLAGLVKSIALEVAATGITCNVIQPGTVRTELFNQTHGARARVKGITLEEQEQALIGENPQRRLVIPEEIAAAVSYLLSDGAASVNGLQLTVDGGRSII